MGVTSDGRAIFKAFLTGPTVTPDRHRGIWGEGVDGQLHLLVRQGDVVELPDGSTAQIMSLNFGSEFGVSKFRGSKRHSPCNAAESLPLFSETIASTSDVATPNRAFHRIARQMGQDFCREASEPDGRELRRRADFVDAPRLPHSATNCRSSRYDQGLDLLGSRGARTTTGASSHGAYRQ